MLVVAAVGSAESLTPEAVQGLVQQYIDQGKLPRFALPERVLVVDSIAKTSVGKLNKRLLRKEFGHLES